MTGYAAPIHRPGATSTVQRLFVGDLRRGSSVRGGRSCIDASFVSSVISVNLCSHLPVVAIPRIMHSNRRKKRCCVVHKCSPWNTARLATRECRIACRGCSLPDGVDLHRAANRSRYRGSVSPCDIAHQRLCTHRQLHVDANVGRSATQSSGTCGLLCGHHRASFTPLLREGPGLDVSIDGAVRDKVL